MQRGHRCMQVRFLEQLAQAQFHLAQVAEALRRVQGVGGPIAESAPRRPTANADIFGAGRARPQGAQRGGTDALSVVPSVKVNIAIWCWDMEALRLAPEYALSALSALPARNMHIG